MKNEQLIGKKFGKLTVLSFAESDKSGKRKWLCKCECGVEKVIYEQSFCRGATKSCGCYNKEASRNRMSDGWAELVTKELLLKRHVEGKQSLREIAKELGCSLGCVVRYMKQYEIPVNDSFYDIAGKKFGKLTVFGMSHTEKTNSYWHVECECGTKKIVQGKLLVRASIVSCGCWNKKKGWQGVGDLSGSYWSRMVKGAIKRKLSFDITIEDGWQKFLDQDSKCALSGRELIMDRQYGKNCRKGQSPQTASLDRIDSTLGYVEGNIQWVHTTVNRMKSDLPETEFVLFCREIARKI